MMWLLLLGLAGGLAFAASGAKAEKRPVSDVQLSRNFRLSEFLRSGVMPELSQYKPTPVELANVSALVRDVLQPLRDALGVPVRVTSGGRPVALRNAKGQSFDDALRAAGFSPSPTSQHKDFSAADITTTKITEAIQWAKQSPKVRQLIVYNDDAGRPTRLHLAAYTPKWLSPPAARLLATSDNGKTYQSWA